MTTTHPEASRNDVRTPATVAEAEDAWLVAITKGDEEQRRLMLPDCVIVHGPVGNTHERESFPRLQRVHGSHRRGRDQ
ncbi:hypothetical protein ACIBM1_24600 [Streptomyces sp. NPDC050481]|uniref:hypothetical protein n=1 Tax=Streptomyces sp. NPDC050481 TaxID=3365616 RepID=UPI0037AAD234